MSLDRSQRISTAADAVVQRTTPLPNGVRGERPSSSGRLSANDPPVDPGAAGESSGVAAHAPDGLTREQWLEVVVQEAFFNLDLAIQFQGQMEVPPDLMHNIQLAHQYVKDAYEGRE